MTSRLAAARPVGHDADALAAFRANGRMAGHLAAPHYLVWPMRAWLLQALVRLGGLEQAEQAIAELGAKDRDRTEIRIGLAVFKSAGDGMECRRGKQGNGFLPMLHLLQETRTFLAVRNDRRRNEVDILASLQFEHFTRHKVEPSPDGQVYLVYKTADRAPRVPVPRRNECNQGRRLPPGRRISPHGWLFHNGARIDPGVVSVADWLHSIIGRERMHRHALAMSAWSACGQPSASHTPCFHSRCRGTLGHSASPSRCGFTACQMST